MEVWRTDLEALTSQDLNGGKPTISAFALNGMVAGGSEEVGCAGILIFLAQPQDTYKEDMSWPNDDQWAVEKWDRFGCGTNVPVILLPPPLCLFQSETILYMIRVMQKDNLFCS